MKTENVFFANIYSVDSVDQVYYRGEVVNLEFYKHALIEYKRNLLGIAYMKDLNTNEKYRIKLPRKYGMLYVSKSSLQRFNDITHNTVKNMDKEKIKTIGNKYLRK